MALDPRFICSSDLEGIFRDKLTGLPLAAGVVKFYSNKSRATPKTVYQLTGSYPYDSSSFTPLGAEITLSSIGSYQDGGGNNIVIYYLPYELDENDNITSIQELYYVEVFNSGGTQQFTREAWPPLATSLEAASSANAGVDNLIPNGQFLMHNTDYVDEVMGSVTGKQIAQGGWYFRQTTGSTGVYAITFNAETGASFSLHDFPPYSVNINCTAFGNEGIHELAYKWRDVNKFSYKLTNPLDLNQFNLFFAAKLNSGTSADFGIKLISNFGNGGDPEVVTAVDTVQITNAWKVFNVIIDMPDNTAKTVGEDSYVMIAISTPDTTVNVRFTDFAFTIGNIPLTSFPTMTNNQMVAQTIGYMPTPAADGSDLYLPLVYTPEGAIFDRTEIGRIYSTPYTSAQVGELVCDGSSYITSAYSSDGIPYSRLFNKIYNSTVHMPLFGTGVNFVSSYQSTGDINAFIIANNVFGLETLAANGVSSPTFTYLVDRVGGASIDFNAYSNGSAAVTAICKTVGIALGANAGTSGMIVEVVRNTALTKFAFHVVALTAAALGNGGGVGKYFDFGNIGIAYRVWFSTGAETPPAAVGTLIKVNLDLSFSAVDCAIVIAQVIAQQQVQTITAVDASAIPTGSYFTFSAAGANYYAWYTKDGVGTDPAVAGATGIEVPLVTGDVAANVAQKTAIALNSHQFAVPNMRGVFVRGYDPTSVWDINQTIDRFGFVGNAVSGQIGTYELFNVESHTHNLSGVDGSSTAPPNWLSVLGTTTAEEDVIPVGYTGIFETRPINFNLNYVIKY